MSARTPLLALLAAGCVAVAVCAAASSQNRWAKYEREMQSSADDPPDGWEKTEFAFARLRFRARRGGGYYERWGIDANRADRHFSQAIRRLTRVHTRSVEQIIDVDNDEMFDWPALYAVAAGDWVLSPSQAARLRAYFDRGGFLVVDDFHGPYEWASFMAGVEQIFPGATAIDLPDEHPIFHTLYNLTNRVRIPGYNVVRGDQVERGGVDPRWRAILDDKGRVRIAICFNMDMGDAWEFMDDADYPEEYASMACRLGVNYFLYAFTH